MDFERFRKELIRFDPAIPIERARTPPASWYLGAEFLEREKRSVFHRTWQAIGRVDQVAAPGDFFTGSLLGEPYVVVRDGGGTLRAFSNVCRHHATRVAEGEGRCERFVCPYHGWTYDLDGRLRRAPRMAGVLGFDRESLGLRPLAAATWGPIVFLHFGSDPKPLEEELSGLDRHLPESAFAGLTFAARRDYRLRCNWKVYVDNYLDGGYHVEHVHRGLAAQLDLACYRTDLGGRFSVQTVPAPEQGADPARGDFAGRIGAGAVYAWLHPNFMLNRYGPILDANIVVPLSPEETLVRFDYWFEETGGAEAKRFIDRSLAASHTVQEEDIAICERVQEGLGSAAYDRGVYAPQVETPMHHFHRLLAADLSE